MKTETMGKIQELYPTENDEFLLTKRLLKVSKEEGFETLYPEEVEPGTVRELIGNYT